MHHQEEDSSGELVQVATMTVVNGRSTLDCVIVDGSSNVSSGAAPQIPTPESFNVELTIGLLHRRMGHFGNDAMQKPLRGDLVRGTSGVKIEELGGCDYCKLGKMTQKPHPAAVANN